MRKELLGETKNGHLVYLDLDYSHAVTHFEHHPQLRKAVGKIISTLEATEDLVRIEQDMGEPVGTTDLVETADGDEIVYAIRPRRQIYSRFVKGKTSVPSTFVTVTLRKKDHDYFLYTAFVGKNTPSFPGGDYLPEQSKEFWAHHALVWGSQDVISGSETTKCLW